MIRNVVIGLLAIAALSPDSAREPTPVGRAPCGYTASDARRIDFMAAFQEAHRASLAAVCYNDDAAIAKLNAELDGLSKMAQGRNPDVDLSTMEASTGLEICRLSASDVTAGCAKSATAALADFRAAMTDLRSFTQAWR